jgi:glycosyltransferase involved in cell wall biosynthesis
MSESQRPKVTVILPCLNEEVSIERTIREATEGLERAGVTGEVIVVDNGCTDRSVARALSAGARVVCEEQRGYGAALRRGITEARGEIAIMADADLTYDLPNLGQLVERVDDGADLAMACRLDGRNAGTMPLLHRMLGTPVLSFLLRRITNGAVSVRDSQSGYRAFDLDRIRELRLQSTGMEFASEMLLQASLESYRIDEIRLPYRVREGESKLNTLEDGFRHLKLLTLLAPRVALLWPGVAAAIIGIALTVASLLRPSGVQIGDARWQPVFFGPIALVMASLLLVNYTLVQLSSPLRPLAATPRTHERIGMRLATIGAAMILFGIGVNVLLFGRWIAGGTAFGRALALAGFAQALIISGAIWLTSALLHWLLQRQTEYGAGRRELTTITEGVDGGASFVPVRP